MPTKLAGNSKKLPLSIPYFLALLLLILTACNDSTAPKAVAVAQPVPLTTPSETIQPAEPTSVVSDYVAINQYIHETNRFAINYPDNWWSVDQPDGVLFVEPSDQAGYSVFFSDVGRVYNQKELRQYMLTFLIDNLIDNPDNFSLIDEWREADGSLVLQFRSQDDPSTGDMVNELQAYQHDTIVYLLLMSINEAQWAISEAKVAGLLASFIALETKPLATPTLEAPVWELIGPLSAEFGFMSPSDWQILHQETDLVSVAMPETEIIFTANNYFWSPNDPQAAENAIALYLNELETEFTEIQHQPLTEFPLYNLTGATIDFTYKTQAGEHMAGSIITALSGDKIYQIVFTAPALEYENSLYWFNPMYKSFKTLSTEGLIILDE